MKGANLKILLVEDEPIHAKLAQRELTSFDKSVNIHHVMTAEECLDWLENNNEYDLIILDYSLPQKNGIDVLKEIKHRYKSPKPIIMVTGHGNENVAIEALKLGAADYIIKTEDYLKRLPYVVKECIERVTLTKEKEQLQIKLKESEEWYRNIFDASLDAIITTDNQRRIISCNPAASTFLGYSLQELEQKSLSDLMEDPKEVEKVYKKLEKEGRVTNQELEVVCKDKEKKTTLASFFYIRDDKGGILAMGSIFKDITLRKKNEKMLAELFEETKKKSNELSKVNKMLEDYITGKRMPG
ncbi:MAG: response regulator [bacterium]